MQNTTAIHTVFDPEQAAFRAALAEMLEHFASAAWELQEQGQPMSVLEAELVKLATPAATNLIMDHYGAQDCVVVEAQVARAAQLLTRGQ
jgi:hypothetical protein